MAYHWPADTVFQELTLEVEDATCWQCAQPLTICCHRRRRFFTCQGPVQLLSKLSHCSNPACPAHATTLTPEAETALVMPYWVLAWDVFCWLGHRRFARHWSVPQIRDELADRFALPLSADAIERYVGRYQRMVAARHQATLCKGGRKVRFVNEFTFRRVLLGRERCQGVPPWNVNSGPRCTTPSAPSVTAATARRISGRLRKFSISSTGVPPRSTASRYARNTSGFA